jgi:hypothetical protein
MPLGKSLFVGLAVLVSTAVGQTKQDKTPQLLLAAQYVYVEPLLE